MDLIEWRRAVFCLKGDETMGDRILVVDDEQEIADLIEVYLQNENYEVLKYYSAEDALACIGMTEVDLAILDIMLPDISGFTLCRKKTGTSLYLSRYHADCQR